MDKRVSTQIYVKDQCFRYIPRHNFKTFKQQVELTDGQILKFLPTSIRKLNQNFQRTKLTIAIGFWAIDIAFVTFCHKIRIINRVLPNKWAMFAFKVALIVAPSYLYLEIEKNAIEAQLSRIYSSVEDDYRKYKNTGDISKLNPQVQFYEVQSVSQQNTEKAQSATNAKQKSN